MNNNVADILKKIDIEDFIWLINFFIVLFALASDNYERDFVINKNYKSQKIYKTINIGIFIVVFIIYAYFAYTRYLNIKNLKNTSSQKDVFIANLNLVAAILVIIGAGIYLYTEIIDDNVSQEGIDLF